MWCCRLLCRCEERYCVSEVYCCGCVGGQVLVCEFWPCRCAVGSILDK